MSDGETWIPRIGRHQENSHELKTQQRTLVYQTLGVSFPPSQKHMCVI